MGIYTGKVVLVTGAGRGLGREIAIAFAAHGASVAVNDLTPINLDETVRLIRETGGCVKDYLFDVANRMQALAMVDEILLDWGRLDVLINNAAVEPHHPLLEFDEWDWRRTLDVNLSGPFFLIQAAGKTMRQKNGGTILNLGALEIIGNDLHGRSAYAVSKAGLRELTSAAACELATDQIRVNMICPYNGSQGAISSRAQPETALPELAWKAGLLEKARRAGFWSDFDLTILALYLCSSAAVEQTGQVIPVDLAKRRA